MREIEVNDLEFSKTYRDMFDLIDEGILVVDMETNIVLFNRASEKLDELKKEEVIGKTLKEAYESEKYISATRECLDTREAVIDKLQNYTTVHGKSITTISSSYPIKRQGEMLGVLTMTKDITRFHEIMDLFLETEETVSEVVEVENSAGAVFSDLLGNDQKFKDTVNQAQLAADTRANILIYGETGTGKELFAQSIHNASGVKGKFVPINCAAIPENLLESLLFGTSKGAYTGAEDAPGLFEEARDGTLFLDELNSMSVGLQAKLLRAIETGHIRRVGETKEEQIDVRFLSAVNEDPEKLIDEGILRRDLYYRLGVVSLTIPPLRNRPEDILELIKHFIAANNEEYRSMVLGVDLETERLLTSYSWPGNVRELKHVIEHACIMANEAPFTRRHHLPKFILEDREIPKEKVKKDLYHLRKDDILNINLQKSLEAIEKEIIEKNLKENEKNVAQTARKLGLSRQALTYKIKKLNIS